MSEEPNSNDPNTSLKTNLDFQFGAEIEIEDAGFSFQPIAGFELEIDGSVYMYSEDGNLEISLVGGALEENISIVNLNTRLAGEFMENFDEFKLDEAGTEKIQETTGFLNHIQFMNAEEEGRGYTLICSPYLNQYFFILVISATEHWQARGEAIFNALKSRIRFYPQFAPEDCVEEVDEYPDLTIEVYPEISLEDDFLLHVEKGDTSLLLAARSPDTHDQVSLTAVTAPDDRLLYQYDPETGVLNSTISDQPFSGGHGEVCIFFPRDNQQSLQPGNYRFTFAAHASTLLEEVQVIIRTGRALELQAIDLNLWIAAEDERFDDAEQVDQFVTELRLALSRRLSPLNLVPGAIACIHAAPDELATFSTVNVDTDLSDASYMIAETVSNGRALNVGFVTQMITGDGSELEAVSAGGPGMILAPTSPHACILLAWPMFNGDVQRLADTLIQQMVVFSGINTHDTQQLEEQPVSLNREIAWRLRRHPLFYDAD